MTRRTANALFLLPFLAACSMRGQPSNGAVGAEIYAVSGCAACHGDDLRGSNLAPSLLGLGQYWRRADLAGFFSSPDRAAALESRLGTLGKEYQMVMPPYDHLSAEQRNTLAVWLLQNR